MGYGMLSAEQFERQVVRFIDISNRIDDGWHLVRPSGKTLYMVKRCTVAAPQQSRRGHTKGSKKRNAENTPVDPSLSAPQRTSSSPELAEVAPTSLSLPTAPRLPPLTLAARGPVPSSEEILKASLSGIAALSEKTGSLTSDSQRLLLKMQQQQRRSRLQELLPTREQQEQKQQQQKLQQQQPPHLQQHARPASHQTPPTPRSKHATSGSPRSELHPSTLTSEVVANEPGQVLSAPEVDPKRPTDIEEGQTPRGQGQGDAGSDSSKGEEKERKLADSLLEMEMESDSEDEMCASAHPAQHTTTLTYEYHVIYSQSYSVPVLYLNIFTPDGKLLPLEEVWNLCPSSYQGYMQEHKWATLTQQEHPLLGRPYLQLHPCHTADLMAQLIAGEEPYIHYLASWLSTVGPLVALKILPAYVLTT